MARAPRKLRARSRHQPHPPGFVEKSQQNPRHQSICETTIRRQARTDTLFPIHRSRSHEKRSCMLLRKRGKGQPKARHGQETYRGGSPIFAGSPRPWCSGTNSRSPDSSILPTRLTRNAPRPVPMCQSHRLPELIFSGRRNLLTPCTLVGRTDS